MQLNIYRIGKPEIWLSLVDIDPGTTVQQLKDIIYKEGNKSPHPRRQSIRESSGGRSLSGTVRLNELQFGDDITGDLYIADLGPQIGWKTVFVCEYIGPIIAYLFTYSRPTLPFGIGNIYDNPQKPMSYVVHIAAGCWTAHYLKRLIETLFVHRFSHETMPLKNLFKNCAYYWTFGLFIGYFINHPNYSEPYLSEYQVAVSLAVFLFSEIGNLSVHLLLRDLRPPGSSVRAVPIPNRNPFTELYHLVSCPNYTYEATSWLAFSIMTQSLPALIFTAVGFVQMTVWALEKHRKYHREFSDYPRSRKAIVPFII